MLRDVGDRGGQVARRARGAHRHVGPREGVEDRLDLGVGAHQDGAAAPRRRLGGGDTAPEQVGDARGLGPLVGESAQHDCGARRADAAQVGAGAADVAGRRDDLRGAAVVATQADDGDAPDHIGQSVEESPVGAVPPVDRLHRVADDEDVGAPAPDRVEEAVLQRVHVLGLVDEEVSEAPAGGLREVGVRGHRVEHPQDEVVEIDHAAALLERLVAAVDVGDLGGAARDPATVAGDRRGVLPWGDGAGVRPVDLGEQVDGAVAQRGALGRDLDELAPLLDHDGHRLAHVGEALAQEAERDGVEGADGGAGGLAVDGERGDAAAHLGGRLAREGDGEDALGARGAVGDAPGDAAREDAGLARAGAGVDDRGGRRAGDGLALVRVESAEEVVGLHGGEARRGMRRGRAARATRRVARRRARAPRCSRRSRRP